MPNIGAAEMAIALAVFILIFGAKKLPALGTAVGQTIRNLKSSVEDGVSAGQSAQDDATV